LRSVQKNLASARRGAARVVAVDDHRTAVARDVVGDDDELAGERASCSMTKYEVRLDR